jgi:hypothetical protein
MTTSSTQEPTITDTVEDIEDEARITRDNDRVRRTDDPSDLGVESRNGTNSLQAFSHSRTIAGYFGPHLAANSVKHSRAADSLTAV